MIVEDVTATYHRNGSGGDGSVLAMGRLTDTSFGQAEPFIAVLWDRNDDDTAYKQCMVFRMRELAEHLVGYLDGATPETIDPTTWRSTEYFLPYLHEPVAEAMAEHWRVLKERTYAWSRARKEAAVAQG